MIAKFLETKPKIAATAYLAPGVHLVGAVEIGEYSSVWYGAVIRADINKIKIGRYSNIQDGSVLHVADDLGVAIGSHVSVGHNALIHACRIDDEVLVGMGAIVLNGARVGRGAVVAAGSVVVENFSVPERALVMGAPARIKRKLTAGEQKENLYWARKYARLSLEYRRFQKYER